MKSTDQIIEHALLVAKIVRLTCNLSSENSHAFAGAASEDPTLVEAGEDDGICPVFEGKDVVPHRLNAPSIEELERGLAGRRQKLLVSGLFDPDWYLQQYADVANANIDPMDHFLMCGSFELRSPGPTLNALAYLKRYSDVLHAGVEPWLHYGQHGRSEGRVGN